MSSVSEYISRILTASKRYSVYLDLTGESVLASITVNGLIKSGLNDIYKYIMVIDNIVGVYSKTEDGRIVVEYFNPHLEEDWKALVQLVESAIVSGDKILTVFLDRATVDGIGTPTLTTQYDPLIETSLSEVTLSPVQKMFGKNTLEGVSAVYIDTGGKFREMYKGKVHLLGTDIPYKLIHTPKLIKGVLNLMNVEINNVSDRMLKGLSVEEAVRLASVSGGKLDRETTAKYRKNILTNRYGLIVWDTYPRKWLGGISDIYKEMSRYVELHLDGEDVGGILAVGMQGTGKTVLARALADEYDLDLVYLSPSSIYSKFVGESEKNMMRIIDTLKRFGRTTILIMDEVEGLMMNRGLVWGDAGVHAKVSSMLLSYLGSEGEEKPFVYMTTNHISVLDPALLRSGRTERIYLFAPPHRELRSSVIDALAYKYNVKLDADTKNKILDATTGFTNAELNQLFKEVYRFGRDLDNTLEEYRETVNLQMKRRVDYLNIMLEETLKQVSTIISKKTIDNVRKVINEMNRKDLGVSRMKVEESIEKFLEL